MARNSKSRELELLERIHSLQKENHEQLLRRVDLLVDHRHEEVMSWLMMAMCDVRQMRKHFAPEPSDSEMEGFAESSPPREDPLIAQLRKEARVINERNRKIAKWFRGIAERNEARDRGEIVEEES